MYFGLGMRQKSKVGCLCGSILENSSGESAHISVEPHPCGTEEINLGDIPQANPSLEDLKREACDQVLLNKVWKRKKGPAKFTLPRFPPSTKQTHFRRWYPTGSLPVYRLSGLKHLQPQLFPREINPVI